MLTFNASVPGVPSPIVDAFARTSATYADRPAIFGLSEQITRSFREVWTDCEQIRAALNDAALPSRPTIVSAVGNCTGLVPLLLACLSLDAGVLLLDGDATDAELQKLAARIGADHLGHSKVYMTQDRYMTSGALRRQFNL